MYVFIINIYQIFLVLTYLFKENLKKKNKIKENI